MISSVVVMNSSAIVCDGNSGSMKSRYKMMCLFIVMFTVAFVE